jgi:D-amino-acid oxidase
VYPIKGQLAVVEPVDFQDPIIHDGYHVFPRDDSAVIGGTHEPFVRDLATSEAVMRQVVEGNRRVAPSLSPERVIGVRAGLRPFREGGPRIAAEVAGSRLILHNYGHGGSGWTIAPGCADLVRELV